GDVPAVIGTGLAGGRDTLVDALAEVGVSPRQVGRVLLTDHRPETVGNIGLFEHASVVSLAHAGDSHERWLQRVCAVAHELVDGDANPQWNHEQVEFFRERYAAEDWSGAHELAVRDGHRIRAGALTLEVVAAPGIDHASVCFYEPDFEWLFVGQTVSLALEPVPDDASAYIASLKHISQATPRAVFPAHGGIEQRYERVFRSAGLAINNLMTNLPFALPHPSSIPEVCRRDLGYFPGDVVRFAAGVIRLQGMVEELCRSGVADREGEGVWAVYRMDRPRRL
ncbi:MAG: glyoxylase-like metal-dependent hydrolase (beta-lactamase superfamily II), partial [Bradymonadia bacterium]